VVYSLRCEGDGGTLLARGVPDREGNLYITAEVDGEFAKAREGILALQPVTFRYKKEIIPMAFGSLASSLKKLKR
jgi:hypothetical protein